MTLYVDRGSGFFDDAISLENQLRGRRICHLSFVNDRCKTHWPTTRIHDTPSAHQHLVVGFDYAVRDRWFAIFFLRFILHPSHIGSGKLFYIEH